MMMKRNTKLYPVKVIKITNINNYSLDVFLNTIKDTLYNEINKILKKHTQLKIQMKIKLNILKRDNIFGFRILQTKKEYISDNSNLYRIFTINIRNNFQNQLKYLKSKCVHIKYLEIDNIKIGLFKCLKKNQSELNNLVVKFNNIEIK